MSIDKNYLEKFIQTTEKAAIGAFPFIGKGDKNAADQGSVDLMRKELNLIDMDGQVDGFSVGIFSTNNIDSIRYCIGGDTLPGSQFLQDNGILYIPFPSFLPSCQSPS